MAQYDVHRNTGQHRDTAPFLLIVQSSQFDPYRRRIVVPLVKASALAPSLLKTLNPSFTFRNVRVILHPLEIVSMPLDRLGEKVGSLKSSADAVIAALDEVFTRAWD